MALAMEVGLSAEPSSDTVIIPRAEHERLLAIATGQGLSAETVIVPRAEYQHLLAIAAGDGPADTIETFCDGERISPAFFHVMQEEGWGPDITYHGAAARIMPAAKRKWRSERARASAAGLRRDLLPEAAE
jgi:hypothetical protein